MIWYRNVKLNIGLSNIGDKKSNIDATYAEKFTVLGTFILFAAFHYVSIYFRNFTFKIISANS